ncbi:Uncharacterised protein [Candidatus Bilamarchaeum dharawalense]|uniref:Uncharacterized protein n=1 Tax=Candidatus Bilamarchaeum dharawalense TaxID=2885759 RepID=A0A5E4LTF7_9ARCH|nr:Uncharacterised protein [Candidatus Bilamarchaeum dharawalense]
MRLVLGLILICLVALSNASAAIVDCEEQYNSCITQCCDACGSHLEYNSKGDLNCYVGTETNQNQYCINMCMPCATQYQQCMGDTPNNNDGNSGACCGSAAVLAGILGLVFFRANNRG